MFDTNLSVLDVDATLAFAADARALADRAETRLIEAAAHFADLHGVLNGPADGSGSLPGMERLVQLGGEGTPAVAEFAPAELGAELQMSPAAAARLIGDALDLRHRLPRLWERVLAADVRPWIGRRTADTTRHLPLDVVAAVDVRVAPWAHSLSWGRLDAIVQAAVIAADPQAAAVAADNASKAQGVWVNPSNDHGIKDIYIRTETPNAIWFDAAIQRVADSLHGLGDRSDKDVRRARAVGVLAQPQRALDLFDQAAARFEDSTERDQPDPTAEALDKAATDERHHPVAAGADPRPHAILYVHVSQESFTRDSAGVARFEGVGPITVDQARRFLSSCDVTIRPVIDLAGMPPVDSYEIPDRMREAVHLRNPVDVSPTPPTPAENATSTTPSPTDTPTTADSPAKPGSTTSPP